MKLLDIYKSSILQSDSLIILYDSLLSINVNKAKQNWADKIYDNKIVYWAKRDGLWRSLSDKKNLLIIGNNNSVLTGKLSADALGILLKMALVMAMATIDKILHEAISYNFSKLLQDGNGKLDKLVNISLSDSYAIAIQSRERKGKGGKIKSRPGHKFKELVLDELYKKSFLKTDQVELICSMCGKKSIFSEFSKKYENGSHKPNILRKKWSKVYERRNNIAHECDIIRKQKAKIIHLNKAKHKQMINDISFIKDFGRYLAEELQQNVT